LSQKVKKNLGGSPLPDYWGGVLDLCPHSKILDPSLRATTNDVLKMLASSTYIRFTTRT